jgi:hypothetical protein
MTKSTAIYSKKVIKIFQEVPKIVKKILIANCFSELLRENIFKMIFFKKYFKNDI